MSTSFKTYTSALYMYPMSGYKYIPGKYIFSTTINDLENLSVVVACNSVGTFIASGSVNGEFS
jgi:hypothetical protein